MSLDVQDLPIVPIQKPPKLPAIGSIVYSRKVAYIDGIVETWVPCVLHSWYSVGKQEPIVMYQDGTLEALTRENWSRNKPHEKEI